MTGLPGLNRMLGQNSPLQPVGQAVQDGDATEGTDTGSKQGEYRIR